MNKITVIGCAGSGKTIFSRKLASKLDTALHTIDELYYGENWQKISQEELKQKLLEVMQGERWIIDGQYTKLIPLRLEYIDTVIFFDFPKRIALWRIVKRYFKQKTGKESVAGNNKVQFPWHQINLVLKYPTERVYEMLKSVKKDTAVIIFRKTNDAELFLMNVK